MGFETSNELFINIKNPPKYDVSKHYYEQSIDVYQFYKEEIRKITEGITVGGYFIHPLLYFHMNFFKTPVPQPNRTKKIMCPPLDDNTLYIAESYAEAESKNLGLLLFGTRGFAKSTFLASISHWTSIVKSDGTMMITGGDEGDLSSIAGFIDKSMTNINGAFNIPTITKDWKKSVAFGYKEDKSTNLEHAKIIIRNVEGGSEGKSEKSAGANPSGYIFDEIGKYSFLKSFEAAIPSFETPYGFNLTPILSGTSGNIRLSKDAKKVLRDPETYKMLPMNWDRLDRSVPEEWHTWKEGRNEKFGTFVPGQMSHRLEVEKLDSNLGDFIGSKNKDLKNIKVKITDWDKATNLLKTRNSNIKDEDSRNKNRMYYPTCIADCFLTASINPYPTVLIEKRIAELENSGKTGKHIDIYRDGALFKFEFSQKKKADIHYEGTPIDAPVVLFGDFPEQIPNAFIFTSGLDDYKLSIAKTSDSLGTFYIVKRRNMDLNEPCERIVASFTTRPERHEDFHDAGETFIESWNAMCLMENADTMFMTHLRKKGKIQKLLVPEVTFSNKSGKVRETGNYGMWPTPGNKEHVLNVSVDHTKERFVIGIDDLGNEIVKHGVDYIDDIDLLKEMLEFKPGVNLDRLVAFGLALVQCKELDKANVRPKVNQVLRDYQEEDKYQHKVSGYTLDSRLRKKY